MPLGSGYLPVISTFRQAHCVSLDQHHSQVFYDGCDDESEDSDRPNAFTC